MPSRLLPLVVVTDFAIHSGWKRVLAAALCFSAAGAKAQGLKTTFDENGVSTLAYNGTTLIDLKAKLGDAFAVGTYQLGKRSGFGAAEKKASWDGPSKTLTWALPWGSVVCQFASSNAARLDIKISIHNTSHESLEGINVYPLGLQFPALPKNFGAPNYPQFHNNLDGPALVTADYGGGTVALLETSAKPLYLGLTPSGAPNHYQLQVGTVNDTSEGFLSKAVPLHRSVPARQTDTYLVSLRFAQSGAPSLELAGDLADNYRHAWPQVLTWNDRRPIGELFLTNPTSTPLPDASPNPRNYNFAKTLDVHSPAGKLAFRAELLAYADRAVRLLKSMNAQGAVIWDLEGQQFPQPDPSYAGDPTQLAKLTPEMDAVADQFFKRFTDAGLKCGLTIRPQRLDLGKTPPHQQDVASNGESTAMIEKMSYARKRWGCTMFYVDSDGGPNDATAPSVFAAVLKALPDVLIIPENIWPQDYAYTAPLASFTAPYKPLHTPATAQAIWPRAFTVTYVGDVPGGDLKKDPALWKQFEEAARRGDTLSFRAWFDDQPLNSQVRQLAAAR